MILFLSSCALSSPKPDLGKLYSRGASLSDEFRNPVIVIPGILGSKLKDTETEKTVWGAFSGIYADPDNPEDARLIALPMKGDRPLKELRDSVTSNGALDSFAISFWGLPIELRAYANILRSLGVGGYRDQQLGESGSVDYGDEHFTCFQFAYDWRRDNVENAKRLNDYILDRRAYIQKEFERRYGKKNADIKFDIVAHSMGGLITRYFLRYGAEDLPADGSAPEVTWAGAQYVERAILVGTPNAGSTQAFVRLNKGLSFVSIFPSYSPTLLGTMPSIYQLLPRVRHNMILSEEGSPLNIYDPAVWETYGWGLANKDNDEELAVLLPDVGTALLRREVALNHLRRSLERATAFNRALDTPASPPEGLELMVVASDAVQTPRTVAARLDGSFSTRSFAAGDGVVLRSSALMDERETGQWQAKLQSPIDWANVYFLFSDHLKMTADPAFTDNVLYLLLEDPR